jgi:hypothetical protein
MIAVMTTDGPESMNITLVNDSLSCSADGNPTPVFHWIELAASNQNHLGHELNLCDTVTFKTVQQATGDSLINVEWTVTFQCVANRSSYIRTLNQSFHVNKLKRICSSSPLPTGN